MVSRQSSASAPNQGGAKGGRNEDSITKRTEFPRTQAARIAAIQELKRLDAILQDHGRRLDELKETQNRILKAMDELKAAMMDFKRDIVNNGKIQDRAASEADQREGDQSPMLVDSKGKIPDCNLEKGFSKGENFDKLFDELSVRMNVDVNKDCIGNLLLDGIKCEFENQDFGRVQSQDRFSKTLSIQSSYGSSKVNRSSHTDDNKALMIYSCNGIRKYILIQVSAANLIHVSSYVLEMVIFLSVYQRPPRRPPEVHIDCCGNEPARGFAFVSRGVCMWLKGAKERVTKHVVASSKLNPQKADVLLGIGTLLCQIVGWRRKREFGSGNLPGHVREVAQVLFGVFSETWLSSSSPEEWSETVSSLQSVIRGYLLSEFVGST